jgi:hypothetical protein
MADTPRLPKIESMKRNDEDGFPGVTPSRDPHPGDKNADPRSHAEVAREERRDDASRRDRRRDDDRVRDDVADHLDRHQGRRR